MGNCGSSESGVASSNANNKPKEIPVKSAPALNNNSNNNSSNSNDNNNNSTSKNHDKKNPDNSNTKNKNNSGQNGKGNETNDEERKEESRRVNSAAIPSKQSSKPSLSVNTNHENNQKDSPAAPPTPQQIAAVQRIQRLVRNKSAWKLAQAEREWKVISHPLPTLPNLPADIQRSGHSRRGRYVEPRLLHANSPRLGPWQPGK
jgi:hypothetical protein